MRILNQIISLFNIIKLNIKIFFFKKLDPNKKVIFFYHPRKLLTLIHTEYIEDSITYTVKYRTDSTSSFTDIAG